MPRRKEDRCNVEKATQLWTSLNAVLCRLMMSMLVNNVPLPLLRPLANDRGKPRADMLKDFNTNSATSERYGVRSYSPK